MSAKDFNGSYHAFKVFSRLAQDEIDRGERTGAKRIYPLPDKARIWISRFRLVKRVAK